MAHDDLVSAFATNVIAQSDAIWRGDSRTGNRHAKRYIAAARALLSLGTTGLDAFARLLHHDRPDVRVSAASYLLATRTAEALATLRPLAGSTGLVALEARMTLERYDRGDLEIR